MGDVFLVPVDERTSCAGQVVKDQAEVLGAVAVCLFDVPCMQELAADTPAPEIDVSTMFSAIMTTDDFLQTRRWPIVGSCTPVIPMEAAPGEEFRDRGYIGAKVYGSGILEQFVRAFYGKAPWDDYYLPDYFDAMLISPEWKPIERLVYSGRHGAPSTVQ